MALGNPPTPRATMDSPLVARRGSIIDGADPRARIVVATAFVGTVALSGRFSTLAAAVVIAGLAILLTRLGTAAVVRRMLPINGVMLVLVLILPWTTGGTPMFGIGPLGYSRGGLMLALGIALKGNAILLGLVALLGTLDLNTLGHALGHLRVPGKLVHLLLFTVRYMDVLHREYLRMAGALRVRAFRPRMDRHTYTTYGHLVGMLLVRSLDRSERILAAMKCRGFRGRFYLLDHFAFSRRDVWFCLASCVVLVALGSVEWLN